MKILILGGGGREHALADALARSPRVSAMYCAPGNAGTAALATNVELDPGDLTAVEGFARREAIDLTVVGPEAPLVAGIADQFTAAGLRLFGPSVAGARLEGSKAYAKAFMRRHGIPTARFAVASDPVTARAQAESLWQDGVVIKADGLAAGKGVVVASTLGEAEEAIAAFMVRRELGAAGATLVIEERLRGPEASYLAFLDGKSWRALPPARDHKALLDGDRGPNTGGMGTLAPAPLGAVAIARIEAEIMEPLLRGLQAEGVDYRGMLFVGLLLAPDGPQVLEFNCRFGDPETQALLPGLDADLADLLEACVAGDLGERQLPWRGPRVCVVAAARGYPAAVVKGLPITGLAEAAAVAGVRIYHAGTRQLPDGTIVTNGGRVLNLVAEGASPGAARERAYRAMSHLRFGGELPVFRSDIGAVAQRVSR